MTSHQILVTRHVRLLGPSSCDRDCNCGRLERNNPQQQLSLVFSVRRYWATKLIPIDPFIRYDVCRVMEGGDPQALAFVAALPWHIMNQ
jgi:hypothetical protein